jgi:hypothetical protein
MAVVEPILDDVDKSIQRTERYLAALQRLVVEAVGAADNNDSQLPAKLDRDYKALTEKTREQIALAVKQIDQLTAENSDQKTKHTETVKTLESKLNVHKKQYDHMRSSLDALKKNLLSLELDFGRAPVFV